MGGGDEIVMVNNNYKTALESARSASTSAANDLETALRAALQQRNVIHVRVLDLDALTPVQASSGPATASIPAQPPVPNPRRL